MSFDSAQLKRSPLLPEGLELKFQYQAGCQLFEYTIHLAQLLALWCLGGLKKVQRNLMLPHFLLLKFPCQLLHSWVCSKLPFLLCDIKMHHLFRWGLCLWALNFFQKLQSFHKNCIEISNPPSNSQTYHCWRISQTMRNQQILGSSNQKTTNHQPPHDTTITHPFRRLDLMAKFTMQATTGGTNEGTKCQAHISWTYLSWLRTWKMGIFWSLIVENGMIRHFTVETWLQKSVRPVWYPESGSQSQNHNTLG